MFAISGTSTSAQANAEAENQTGTPTQHLGTVNAILREAPYNLCLTMISHVGQNDYGNRWPISVTHSRRLLPEHNQNDRRLAVPTVNHRSSGRRPHELPLHLVAPAISATI